MSFTVVDRRSLYTQKDSRDQKESTETVVQSQNSKKDENVEIVRQAFESLNMPKDLMDEAIYTLYAVPWQSAKRKALAYRDLLEWALDVKSSTEKLNKMITALRFRHLVYSGQIPFSVKRKLKSQSIRRRPSVGMFMVFRDYTITDSFLNSLLSAAINDPCLDELMPFIRWHDQSKQSISQVSMMEPPQLVDEYVPAGFEYEFSRENRRWNEAVGYLKLIDDYQRSHPSEVDQIISAYYDS